MNNFIFICEDDFKEIIMQAVILAVLFGNNNHNNNNHNRKDNINYDFHESYKK